MFAIRICVDNVAVTGVLMFDVRVARLAPLFAAGFLVTACASTQPVPVMVSAPAAVQTPTLSTPTTPTLRRRVAIGRFSNSTNYGRSLLMPGQADPIANQASDMLMARLVDSGKFLVFERDDIDVVVAESELTGRNLGNLPGVDALIVGSVTEFGRRTEGQAGFLSSTMRQTVRAVVEIRLVDAGTGRAFFSTTGTGEAAVEAGEVAGFGSRAAYDATLNDRAISAAISDLINNVIQRLEERRWFTDILRADGATLYLSGGARQGLRVGDRFRVESPGQTIVSNQSGLPITLPGNQIATIEIVSFFGDDAASEGAIARVVEGAVPSASTTGLRVVEMGS